MLLCGCPPPLEPTASLARLVSVAGADCGIADGARAGTFDAAASETPLEEEPLSVCVCDGISLVRSVIASAPPTSPASYGESPGPWPTWIGTRPRRSGSANVTTPLPP